MNSIPSILIRSRLDLRYNWREILEIMLRVFFEWFFRWTRLIFTVQPQQQTNWCWAAVAVSVSHYYDPASTWTQCSLVNAELGQTTCCQNGGSSQCNQPWSLSSALTRTGNLARMLGAAVSFNDVASEINNNRLLGVRIGWSGGGGHFLLLDGYRPSDEFVAVEDPWYGASDVSISTLTTSYKGSGSWTHTYYTQP